MALRKHLPPQQVEFLQKLMPSAYETFTEHLVCARDRFVDLGGGWFLSGEAGLQDRDRF